MTVTIDATDTRSIKALEIAAGASQWAKIRSKDGQHKAYGIASSCQPGRFYLVTCSSCDCQAAKRHPGQACKHQLAVRLHVELVKASAPKAKSKPVTTPAPAGRPVLTMVRHGDGDFTWERRADVARAARYDAIFGSDGAAF